MPKILVTGMSGTGKSAALQELGERPAERAQIMRNLAEAEPLLRAAATTEIDAIAPLSQVVRHLENLTQGTTT